MGSQGGRRHFRRQYGGSGGSDGFGGARLVVGGGGGGGGGDALAAWTHSESGGREGLAAVWGDNCWGSHFHGPELLHFPLEPPVLFSQ